MEKSKKNQWVFTLANVLAALALLYIFNRAIGGFGPKEVPYSDFLAEVRAGHMAEVQITEKTLLGVLKEEKPNSGAGPGAHGEGLTPAGHGGDHPAEGTGCTRGEILGTH